MSLQLMINVDRETHGTITSVFVILVGHAEGVTEYDASNAL